MSDRKVLIVIAAPAAVFALIDIAPVEVALAGWNVHRTAVARLLVIAPILAIVVIVVAL